MRIRSIALLAAILGAGACLTLLIWPSTEESGESGLSAHAEDRSPPTAEASKWNPWGRWDSLKKYVVFVDILSPGLAEPGTLPILFQGHRCSDFQDLRRRLRAASGPIPRESLNEGPAHRKWVEQGGLVAPGVFSSDKILVIRCAPGVSFGWVWGVLTVTTVWEDSAWEHEREESPAIVRYAVARPGATDAFVEIQFHWNLAVNYREPPVVLSLSVKRGHQRSADTEAHVLFDPLLAGVPATETSWKRAWGFRCQRPKNWDWLMTRTPNAVRALRVDSRVPFAVVHDFVVESRRNGNPTTLITPPEEIIADLEAGLIR